MKQGKPLRRRRKGRDALLSQKLDVTVSALIRARGQCERCGRRGKLDCAHIIGRQNQTLRWCPRNLMCLCFVCHRSWHDHPLEAAKWIREHRPSDVAYVEEHQNVVTHWTIPEKEQLLEDLQSMLALEQAA